MAVMLIAALGLPSTAGATGRAAPPVTTTETEPKPEAKPTAGPEPKPTAGPEPKPTAGPEPKPEQPSEPAPAPTTEAGAEPPSKVELTPEEIERRELELRLEQATLHWQEGKRLFDNAQYAEAAVEFERSLVAVPAADTLYSVALSYERAGKPVEAVRALKRYLAHTDCSDLPEEERTSDCATMLREAQAALAEQRLRVGELVLSLGEGVKLREVRVAGRVVPLDDFPLLLLPGTVDVEVFGLGPEERRSRPVSITGGEQTTFYVAPFEREAVTRPDPEPDPDDVDDLRPERRRLALRVGFWVGTGLTVASGTALAVMGALTLHHQRRFNAEKCAPQCWEMNPDGTPKLDEEGNIMFLDRPFPLEHEEKYNRYRPVANALVGVTVGLAVTAALLGSFAFRKRARERAADEQARVRARVRVGATGIVVRW